MAFGMRRMSWDAACHIKIAEGVEMCPFLRNNGLHGSAHDLGHLKGLNESRTQLLSRVQALKKDLESWRGKPATQVKSYRAELGDLRSSLNSKVEQLRVEEKLASDDAGETAEDDKKPSPEKYWDWELSNDTKPIWMRSPKEFTKDEYHEFYKTTFKEYMDPLAYTHFTAEVCQRPTMPHHTF